MSNTIDKSALKTPEIAKALGEQPQAANQDATKANANDVKAKTSPQQAAVSHVDEVRGDKTEVVNRLKEVVKTGGVSAALAEYSDSRGRTSDAVASKVAEELLA